MSTKSAIFCLVVYILLQVAVVVLGQENAHISALQHECTTDSQCNYGDFCYENEAAGGIKICHTCFNCEYKFNREERRTCARSFWECGSCLKEFREEMGSDGNPKDACVLEAWTRTEKTPTPTASDDENSDISAVCIVFIIIASLELIFLIVLGYLHYTKKTIRDLMKTCGGKKSSTTQNNIDLTTMAQNGQQQESHQPFINNNNNSSSSNSNNNEDDEIQNHSPQTTV